MVHLVLSQFDRKIFVWPIIYSTIIVACLFITAGTILYYVNLTEFRDQASKQQEIEATGLELLIHKNIINMKNDVSVFSEIKIIKDFVTNPAPNKSVLYNSIKKVIEKSRYYYQFRILNLSGREIFRVNYLKGKACLVPDGQLQDKSKRYYYQEAVELEKDQVMVSNYDYNIEMGKFERPINPTLRITTPIYINNKKEAYLIINFNTDLLKEEMELFNRLTRFNIYIINDQRQFLCYKSFNINLDHVYEDPDDHKTLVDKVFAEKNFFRIADSYFFKIKVPLNKTVISKNNPFIYLAVELPAATYTAYKEGLSRKILFYILLLFIVTLVVVYVLLFLSMLMNRRSVQLRKAMKLLELSEDGVAVTDEKGIIEYINPAFEKMYRCSRKETAGLNITNFNSSFYGEDFYTAMQERLDSTGKWEGDIVEIAGENTRQVKHLKIERLSDPKTGQIMYLRSYTDITRLKDSDKMIKRLSSLDYLTGLPNKQSLLTRINEKAKKFSSRGGKFAISSVSIFNLKEINDSYGFDIGDKTILLFAERIKGKIRNTDTLGRLGDNHFLLVSDSDSLESVGHYITDLFKNCTASPFIINEWEIYLSINVGISVYPDNGADGEDLMKAASLARGDKRPDDRLAVNFYLDKMLLRAKEKSSLLSLLEKAVERKELYLEFQPKIDSRDGAVVGSEALIRWNNPKLGKVSPSDFIPLAEDNGLISKISYWVIRELCTQIKTWRDRGLPLKPVSFNLSLYDFEKEDFPAYLFDCAEEYEVDSGDIQIEMTERVFAKNKDKIIEKINQLKNRGFKVLIDDFGTGYSSLEYLKEFKIDILKIDRAFIKDYPENSDGKIIKTICALANSLDMEIVCEGAELKSQINFLNSIGCYIIQGFYYSPPVSSGIFENMLAEGKINRPQGKEKKQI
jgi:diguanylate cyclase (GGDEF)-like protein/PAS domain S-box-containing protein